MSKPITMSIHQFLEMEKGNITLKEIKKEIKREKRQEKYYKKLDDVAGIILNNPQLKKVSMITIAALMSVSKAALAVQNEAATQAISTIHDAEAQIIPILQVGVGALCTIMVIIEVSKALIGRRSNDIAQIFIKYIMAYIAIAGAPWIFNLIRNIFTIA